MTTTTTTQDIEELHTAALCRKSTTYTDPSTGFLVFTELAHYQRGTCCGNQCRHCPYGWENVRSTAIRSSSSSSSSSTEQPPRVAKVKSGDQAAIQARLQRIDKMAEAAAKDPPSRQATESTTAPLEQRAKKTGGRHGGRLTTKNVPYTRGGDKGTSQLLTGERRSKADDAFEAMGTVDELCSFVGVVHAQLVQDAAAATAAASVNNNDDSVANKDDDKSSKIDIGDQLLEIMSRLFDIGSHVAKPSKIVASDDESESEDSFGSDTKEPQKSRFVADGIGGGFDPQHVQELEDWIDQLTEDLPELNSFLLPTGSLAAAHLHTARCVCRRAERRMVPLVTAGVCDPTALTYVNRLSDYLFSAARWVNLIMAQQAEIQYRRPHRGSKQRTRVLTATTNQEKE